MKVILFANGECEGLGAIGSRVPSSLLTLVDRPFIVHVVEQLVDRGATSFEVIISRASEKFEQVLGNGSKWNAAMNYHFVPDAEHPYGVVNQIVQDCSDEVIVLAHGDRLPQLESQPMFNNGGESTPSYYLSAASDLSVDTTIEWSGWAVITKQMTEVLTSKMDEKSAGEALIRAAGEQSINCAMPTLLSARTFEQLLAAQAAVMTGEFKGIQINGNEAANGVWVGEHVTIHPSATLAGPVYIGAGCCIAQNAHIGPNAVIGDNCVVDDSSAVSNSLVMNGTYIGEGLDLGYCVMDRDLLVHAGMTASLTLETAFLIGGIDEASEIAAMGAFTAQPAGKTTFLQSLPSTTFNKLWTKMLKPNAAS